ncbi:glycosyltransferase [Nocardioides marinquilinus]|uniref:Glycosyltransferase n=1 Tax=Nocardioides marinquilinus TaxID=1210400 RepID=A0ABP9P7E6_9ACTN
MSTPRVTVVHERLTEVAGSERVVEQVVAALPGSRVVVPIADPAARPAGLEGVEVSTGPLQRLYRGGGRYAHLLPLLPLAMRHADLGRPDAVVASHHAFALRVRPPDGVPMVGYVHSPARWIWDPAMLAGEVGGRVGETGLRAFAATQRRADRRAAQRPELLLANSSTVADRIRRWWHRDAEVLHPPVRTDLFTTDPATSREDFFLMAGRLVPYKRPEAAVRAARLAGVRLVVAGDGRAMAACRAEAGPGTELVGRVDDATMIDLMRRARALVFPGVEDFGIVPVEAMACGTPVVAQAAGGALDSVVEGVSGTLVESGDDGGGLAEALAAALGDFDDTRYDAAAVRRHAEGFGEQRFRDGVRSAVERVLGGSISG